MTVPGPPRTGTLTIGGETVTVIQAGTSAAVEGPSAGSDSYLVACAGTWTATANVPWLHTASVGSGNAVAVFTFDANPGATRTGTLTIAGSTLVVTQAGSGYVAVSPTTTEIDSGLSPPARPCPTRNSADKPSA